MIKKFENFVNEHYNDVDIATIGVDDAHKVLDNKLAPGEVALLLATDDEELLNDFISRVSETMSPAAKDRFTKIFKIVK